MFRQLGAETGHSQPCNGSARIPPFPTINAKFGRFRGDLSLGGALRDTETGYWGCWLISGRQLAYVRGGVTPCPRALAVAVRPSSIADEEASGVAPDDLADGGGPGGPLAGLHLDGESDELGR